MKLSGILFITALCSGCASTPDVVLVDPRVMYATNTQRRQWVIEQARGPGASLFSRDYEWIITAKSIGPKEAKQLAYLFFYSTGTIGGYFDDAVTEGSRFRFRFHSELFHSELGPVEVHPVFVDSQSGLTWQEGQKEKIDMLSLIRLFIKTRLDQIQKPNKTPLRTLTIGPSSVMAARFGYCPHSGERRRSLTLADQEKAIASAVIERAIAIATE